MYKVLVSDPISDAGLTILKEDPNVEVTVSTDLTPEQLQATIKSYDALVVRSQTQVNEAIINAADQLKIIGRAGVGVDNIDVDAATAKGILVVNAPSGNTISAAEHAMAMMMSLARNIPSAHQSTISGHWDRKSYRGVELKGKTLGILGMGRIGAEVAQRARSFQMTILAYDPFLTQDRAKEIGVEKSELDEIFTQADFMTVHTPLTRETHHLINDAAIEKMTNARIINCARGGIIDEDALVRGIKAGKVVGAALDVFEEEPLQQSELTTLPEVVVTPHLGASTAEAQENVALDVAQEVVDHLQDGSFTNAVNLPKVSPAVLEKLNPYISLGRQLGESVIQIIEGTPVSVKMTYSGELTETETTPLTRTILQGVLSYYLGGRVNIINAEHLAKEYGISHSVEQSAHTGGFTSSVQVEITTDQEIRRVSGTLLNGYGARINKIDNYAIDVAPEEHLVLIHHSDLPGAIGKVGSILGEANINIGTMQVGRQAMGGNAIMVLTVDRSVDDDVVSRLTDLDDIHKIKNIVLS